MPLMVQRDTPPGSPFNIRDIMNEGFDDEDLNDMELLELDAIYDDDYNDDAEDDDEDDDDQDEDRLAMESYRDDAALTFTNHSGSVFCCCLDPNEGLLAVTGGEDDTAYLWETDSGHILIHAEGFKDSVITARFSHDSKYLAAADMSGVIKVWRIHAANQHQVNGNTQEQQEHKPEEVWSESVDEVHWLRWHSKANILLCGTAAPPGHVHMWKIPSGECKIMPGQGPTTEAGMFMPDGKRAVIGYKDGSVRVFDLNSCSIVVSLQLNEMSSILCLDVHKDNNLIAAGTLNARVALFATQTGKLVCLYECIEDDAALMLDGDEPISVETVAFSKDSSLPVIAVATTFSVHVWDYTKQVLRHKCPVTEGICMLVWGHQEADENDKRASPLVYVGCQEGQVKVLDMRSVQVVAQLLGHTSSILDMSLSKDGKKLLTVSDDKCARIFVLDNLQLPSPGLAPAIST